MDIFLIALTAATALIIVPLAVVAAGTSTFRWNPLDGCADPAVAIRRADAFTGAVSQGRVEDSSFWAAKASDYLRAYFHAAALAGLDLRHVARWVSGSFPGEHWPVTTPITTTPDTGALPAPGPALPATDPRPWPWPWPWPWPDPS